MRTPLPVALLPLRALSLSSLSLSSLSLSSLSLRAFALATLTFATLSGCDEPGPPVPDGDGGGAPTVQLGQGAVVFEPSRDGTVLEYVEGCQGSQHVWAAVRTAGIDRRRAQLFFTLTRASDGEPVSPLLEVRVNMDAVDVDGFTAEWTGGLLLIPTVEEAVGRSLVYTVEVRDPNGARAVSRATTTLARARCGHCREDDPSCDLGPDAGM